MAVLTAQAVITRATELLNDTGNTAASVSGNVRWTVAELLNWVSDAQRQIILMRPNAKSQVAIQPLVVGTRQSIPSDGWVLIKVVRNFTGLSGTPARAVKQVEVGILDSFNPDWHSDAPTKVAQNYTYDVLDQKAFFVYPPNDGTGFVEINYSQMPDDVTATTDQLVLDSIYLTPMVDYVCYRAFSKDAEFADGQLAANYYTSMSQAVMGRDQAEKEDSPDATFSPPGGGNYKPGGQ
jgi:hypothetical protein